MFKFSSSDFQMQLPDGNTLTISNNGTGTTADITIKDNNQRILQTSQGVSANEVVSLIGKGGTVTTGKPKSAIPRMGAKYGANAIGNKIGDKMEQVRMDMKSGAPAEDTQAGIQPQRYGGISDDIDTDDSTNYQAPVEEERKVTEYFNRNSEAIPSQFEPITSVRPTSLVEEKETGYKYVNEIDIIVDGVVDENTYRELLRIRNTLIETEPEGSYDDLQQFVQLNFALPNAPRCSFVANSKRTSAIFDAFYLNIKSDLQKSIGVKSLQLAKRSAEHRDDRETINQFSKMPIHIIADIDRGSETETDIAILRILENTVTEFQFLYNGDKDEATISNTEPLIVNVQTEEREYKIAFTDSKAATIYMQHSLELSKALYRTSFEVNVVVESMRVAPVKGKGKGMKQVPGAVVRGVGNFEIEIEGETTPQLKNALQRTVNTLEENYSRYRYDEANASTAFGGLKFNAFQTICLIKPLNQKAYTMLDKVASSLVTSFQKIGATDFEPVPLERTQPL